MRMIPLVLWGIGGALAAFMGYRVMRKGGAGYTAEDVAALGTVAPGANIFADTGGAIGYGVPSVPGSTPETTAATAFGSPEVSAWFRDSTVLNSGPNSTSPGASTPVATTTSNYAMGYEPVYRPDIQAMAGTAVSAWETPQAVVMSVDAAMPEPTAATASDEQQFKSIISSLFGGVA